MGLHFGWFEHKIDFSFLLGFWFPKIQLSVTDFIYLVNVEKPMLNLLLFANLQKLHHLRFLFSSSYTRKLIHLEQLYNAIRHL